MTKYGTVFGGQVGLLVPRLAGPVRVYWVVSDPDRLTGPADRPRRAVGRIGCVQRS